MNPRHWPDWLDEVWAKSAEQGAGGQPETLAQHTWEVLSRLADLIHLRLDLPDLLSTPRLWHVLFWSGFLHDFGKTADGFQALLRGGPRWVHRHEVVSLAFVDWIAEGFTTTEQSWLASAIASHHKDATDIQNLYWQPDDPEDDQLIPIVAQLDASRVQGLWRWISECSSVWISELGLSRAGISVPPLLEMWQAVELVQKRGVARIRYWLKTYRRLVRDMEHTEAWSLIIATLTLRGHLINADHGASAHAGALPRANFDAHVVLTSRNLNPNNLFAHQRQASVTGDSALLTAPTGSGKTEAALLWAARQAEIGNGLPRLFYALPYQASMNAMKLRLEQSFPNLVGLQHSRSLLALYRLLLDREYGPEEAARQARWARNLAQLNHPPIRVFSPYQMLKGMYRLKGYEALLCDYHQAAFIFDEIHAYDIPRLALILTTIKFLKQHFNARFLVMSATFPTLIKGWLRQALGSPVDISATPKLYQIFRRHQLVLLDCEILSESSLSRITVDAKAGKSVLVACNRVDRAQAVYRELRQRLDISIHVELLHGRFNMRDRSTKEKLVREIAGSDSQSRKAIVLVATQVVEVSLDIDLDTIYSEPAPLEALIQRFGRINRRRKQASLAKVHVFRQPDDGQKIYEEVLVKRTLAILDKQNHQPIDESAIGEWVDIIYGDEIAAEWERKYLQQAENFKASCVKPLRPFAADEQLAKDFYRAFDGVEVLPISLNDEYQQLKEEEPILAGELLVPITWGRYRVLKAEERVTVHEAGEAIIVNAPYNAEIGLSFDEPSTSEGK